MRGPLAPACALQGSIVTPAVALFLPPFVATLYSEGHDVAQQWPASASNRSARDRRQQARVEQYFDCTWLSEWSEERSRVSSLSARGCYIECRSAAPPTGTPLAAVTIKLPTGEITLQGKVIHAIRGVGFAVEFTDVDEDARARLSAL